MNTAISLNQSFSVKTGRTYDSAQVLECTVVVINQVPDWFDTAVINVVDSSRNMKFHVEVTVDELDELSEVKALIIDLYDTGRYTDGLKLVEPAQSEVCVKVITQHHEEIIKCESLDHAGSILGEAIDAAAHNGYQIFRNTNKEVYAIKGKSFCRHIVITE